MQQKNLETKIKKSEKIETSISACYHPTKVLLIDDNINYLNALHLELDKTHAIYQCFNCPKTALDFLTKTYKPSLFNENSILHSEEEQRDYRRIEVNIRSIQEAIYNPNRFNQISVVVVDQAMPGLKGLALCQALKHSPIKKLMLTGELENEQVIQAFNDRIIDKFISKNAPNFSDRLNSSIYELQQAYFKDLSRIIIDSLTKNLLHHSPSCLNEPRFVQLFYTLFHEKGLTEYYLSDANGSFLFLNNAGLPSWLAVKDRSGMQAALFDAEVANQKLSPSALASLKQKQCMPFLYTEEDYYLDPGEWESKGYLHPANMLTGDREIYYYSYVESGNYKLPGNIHAFQSDEANAYML